MNVMKTVTQSAADSATSATNQVRNTSLASRLKLNPSGDDDDLLAEIEDDYKKVAYDAYENPAVGMDDESFFDDDGKVPTLMEQPPPVDLFNDCAATPLVPAMDLLDVGTPPPLMEFGQAQTLDNLGLT